MHIKKLSDAEIQQALLDLPKWTLREQCFYQQFTCRDFVTAFGFMTQVALVAERFNHHPDWRNVYKTVEIKLSTHDVSGISERDIQMARDIDTLWENLSQ